MLLFITQSDLTLGIVYQGMVVIKPLQYRRLLVRVTVAVVYGKPYTGEAERFHHNGEEPSVSRLKVSRISKNRYSAYTQPNLFFGRELSLFNHTAHKEFLGLWKPLRKRVVCGNGRRMRRLHSKTSQTI